MLGVTLRRASATTTASLYVTRIGHNVAKGLSWFYRDCHCCSHLKLSISYRFGSRTHCNPPHTHRTTYHTLAMSLTDRTNGANGSSGTKSSPPPAGIYVPVPTFFAKEGSASYDAVTPPLDLETQSEHSLFLVKGGIRGLVILGSTGEAIFLRSKERNELIASQRKTLDEAGYKDRPIIAGTATQQIDDTLQMIKESKEAGAEYAMVLGPGYFAPSTSQQGIQKWFEAVADKSVLPVMM